MAPLQVEVQPPPELLGNARLRDRVLGEEAVERVSVVGADVTGRPCRAYARVGDTGTAKAVQGLANENSSVWLSGSSLQSWAIGTS